MTVTRSNLLCRPYLRGIRTACAGLSSALVLTALPVAAQDDPVQTTCTMAILCLEASPCSEWTQEVTITEGTDGEWQVVFDASLPSNFTLAADLPAPEGALEPAHVTTLIRTDADTQSVQLVSFAHGGEVVVTLHQPHLRPRSVTGYGVCDDGSEGAGE